MPDLPLVRVDLVTRTSGGGSAVLNNVRMAARLHPDILGFDPRSKWVLVPRNWMSPAQLASRRCILMPQNAWPWSGDVRGLPARRRRLALRAASELSMRRAAGVLRIGSAIPPIGNLLGNPLGNVLDEGFEVALQEAEPFSRALARDRTFLSIGSLTTYRGLKSLLRGFATYREEGGRFGLTIVGEGKCDVDDSRHRGVTIIRARLPRSEAIASLRTAAAAVFPSSVEASPIAVIEADEVARDVVLSDITGHREASRRGRFYEPRDPAALARCLHDVERTYPAFRPDAGAAEARRTREELRHRWAREMVRRISLLAIE